MLYSGYEINMIWTKTPINLSITLFIVFVGLSKTSARQSSQRVRLTEGEDEELLCQFDYEPDVDIQIRIGNRWPFYKSKKIHAPGLTGSQRQRFSIHVKEEPSETILVRLSISSVSREDEGTLVYDLLKDGQVLLDHTKIIDVSVDFPPGQATCRQENHNIDNSGVFWALMKCSAPAGSDHGIIECYQRGERMPPWARPIQNETTLTQRIWMRKTIPIHCCSSPFDKPKGVCQCDDVQWDPVSQKFNEGTNPCLNLENAFQTTIPPEKRMKSNIIIITEPKKPTENSDYNMQEIWNEIYLLQEYTRIICVLLCFLIGFEVSTAIRLGILMGKINAKVRTLTFSSDDEHDEYSDGV